MIGFGWSLTGVASRLLEREEREAVLGDLCEASESGWNGLLEVSGLVLRRQVELWRSWRPWLAGFGLALPASFLLMGISLSVSNGYELCAWLVRNHPYFDPKLVQGTGLSVGPRIGFVFCQFVLMIGLAWTVGFVVGRLSRRTLWMSALLCLSPCLFCLARFRMPEMSRASLLLFVLPAIWGAWCGLRVVRIRLGPAVILAAAITALMIRVWGVAHLWSTSGWWMANWLLIWPAWYLVANALRLRIADEDRTPSCEEGISQ
jgi:hypothetical protein